MKRANLTRQRLAALALLAIVLFSYPMLNVAGASMIFGFPSTFVYLFGVWAIIIGLAMRTAERRQRP